MRARFFTLLLFLLAAFTARASVYYYNDSTDYIYFVTYYHDHGESGSYDSNIETSMVQPGFTLDLEDHEGPEGYFDYYYLTGISSEYVGGGGSAPSFSWVDGFLHDPDWLTEEGEGGGDTDQLTFGFLPAAGVAVWEIVTTAAPELVEIGAPESAASEMVVAAGVALGLGELTRINEENLYSYAVYELHNPTTDQYYIGRTSGQGTIEQVVARRIARHNKPGFTESRINAGLSTHGWSFHCWAAIRGREQQVMDSHLAIGHSLANLIRGVSADNRMGYTYWLTSTLAFEGSMAPFSGNLVVGIPVPYDAVYVVGYRYTYVWGT